MRTRKSSTRVLSWLLALCMVVGLLPVSSFAAPASDTDSTANNVSAVQAYSSQLRAANQKTDYSAGGFTWDTETKDDSWRYFNGVMMDAFLMEGDTAYADAFYNGNIDDNGTIANYNTGELDSVAAARGLFDLLDSANASKYKKAIQYIYTQLEKQVTYANCGGNYLHKQDTSGNPTGGWDTWNIGLDGLYMAEPFLMECANAIDSGKLTLTDKDTKTVLSADIYQAVYKRFVWVADTMYDETNSLYHHGWNVSENKGNGRFWGRGIGWYAMALVDVIDMMPDGDKKNTLAGKLTKLFDGMLKYQDADTGMWYNVVNRDSSLTQNYGNKLETSVSSMMAYALMKAYNKGYVTDEKYGQAGLAAFNGTVGQKLSDNNVADTYQKSSVGDTDEYYTTNKYEVNEAKGVGALIMASTLANTTAAKLSGGESADQGGTGLVPDETTDNGSNAGSGTVNSVSARGNLPGSTTYVLDIDDVDSGATYLIVSAKSGTAYALRNNGESSGSQQVSISGTTATISQNEDSSTWTFTQSGSSWQVKNSNTYLRLNDKILDSEARDLTVTNQGNGAYQISYKKDKTTYYLKYSDGWTRSKTATNVYLFKQTSAPGAAVTLTVTPGSASLKSGETANLAASVLVDNKDATSSTISWSSSNSAVAAVSDSGVVTAVSDGTATITATLTSANGRTPAGTVKVEIPVTVISRTVTSATLTGNDAVTTRKGVEPNFSNVRLNVTYDDKSTDVITTANGLVISGYDVNKIGVHYAKITYQGKEYGTIKVTVEGNPYEGLEKAAEYPEYPADGAVRIDKTATGQNFNSTGVVQVELDTAGISVKQGVDVVVVLDMSNSMLWKPGTTTPVTSGSKFEAAKTATQKFANTILSPDADGTATSNTMSLVYFCSVDDERNTDTACPNTVDTALNRSSSLNDAITAINNLGKANGNTPDFVVEDGATSYNWPGGTNYDYAFEEANEIVTALKNDADRDQSRGIFILFMSDGAPGYYNGVYYKSGTSEYRSTAYTDSSKITKYSMSSTAYQYSSGANGNFATLWGNHIKEELSGAKTAKDNGAIIYSIGFDVASGNKLETSNAWTNISASDLESCLKNISSDDSCYNASSNEDLISIFDKLATKIKYAGTNARVTDTVDSNFTLQTTSFGTDTQTPSAITVTAYDLYTKAETNDKSLIGTRKDTSTALETVRFKEDGTEAYSDQLNGNIMTIETDGSVTIAAQYFTYTKDDAGVEKFVWNIGDITDKEVALSYYAYLKGSMDGTCAEGVYYTNEGATLEYVDINGKHATKEFPKPAVAWGGASTSFEYYLVNYKGEPVNRAGQVVPFANRIVLYGDTVALNLNQDITIPAQSINAADYLPEGYFLYDVKASYTVSTASSTELNPGITISKPSEDARKTTGEGSAQVTQTGAQTTILVSADEETYIQSRVAFGVRWDLTPIILDYELVKDQIVIDYGKSIQKNVLENDSTIPSNYTGTLVGFIAYNSKTNLKQAQQSAGSTEYTTANGTYTIVDNKVNFQPKQLLSQVEKVFCVVKVTNNDDISNYYYLYEELDIIPATMMYYETDFADGVFTLKTTGESWKKVTENGDNNPDGPQDDGTIGQNKYGYDSSYANDTYQSDDNSWEVIGAGSTETTANFSFKGTGFDIISRTGADEGFIRVSVYSDSEKTTLVKRVTVLNKSESNLTLYQIPVVSIEDLTYGTYYVEIGVSKPNTSAEYESLSNNGQFHFDAIRIYNPINASADAANKAPNSDEGIAYAAYVADGEANASIQEIRKMLITSADSGTPDGWIENTYDDTINDEIPGVVFVDRNQSSVGINDYKTIGPNNEVYLTAGQAIGFKLTVTGESLPSSIDIGAKSANGQKTVLHVAIYSDLESGNPISQLTKEIDTSTAQFYDLLAGSKVDDLFKNDNKTVYILIDSNEEKNILSITDLKVAYGNTTGAVSITSNTDLVKKTAVSETVSEINCDVLSAQFTEDTMKRSRVATMHVVTEPDAEKLEVLNMSGVEMTLKTCEATMNEDGTKTWTVKFKVTSLGNQSFTVTGYGADGTAGASATASIKVKAR